MIWVIEDNTYDAELVSIELLNYFIKLDIMIFDNAADAIRALGVQKPDVILLDLKLIGDNGFTFLYTLLEDVNNKEIPVFVVTGSDDDKEYLAAQSLGARGVIRKPFEFRKFVYMLKRINYRLRIEKYANE